MNAYTNVLNGLDKFSNESLLYELYRQYKPRQPLGNLNFGVNIIDRIHNLPPELQQEIRLVHKVNHTRREKCIEIRNKLTSLLNRFTRTTRNKKEFFDDLEDGFDAGHLKDTLRRYVQQLVDNDCFEHLNNDFIKNVYKLWIKRKTNKTLDNLLYLILKEYTKEKNKRKRSLRRL